MFFSTWHQSVFFSGVVLKNLPRPSVVVARNLQFSTVENPEPSNSSSVVDEVWSLLSEEAENIAKKEPLMRALVEKGVLQHSSLKDALAFRLSHEFGSVFMPPQNWSIIFKQAYNRGDCDLEELACLDLISIKEMDHACDKLFTPFMFFKGFKSVQAHRVGHTLWKEGRKDIARLIQSRVTELYAVDIHPAAKLGKGIVLDHATGVVIGETAVVGDNCYFLHGVTLGGNGKASGDRHPKIGNNVVLGCNSTVLGNIVVGHGSKAGAGAVIVRPIPGGSTAVGFPSRVILPRHSQHDYCI